MGCTASRSGHCATARTNNIKGSVPGCATTSVANPGRVAVMIPSSKYLLDISTPIQLKVREEVAWGVVALWTKGC